MIWPPQRPGLLLLDFAANAYIKAEAAKEPLEISRPGAVRATIKMVVRNTPQNCVSKVHKEHAIWAAELRRGVDPLRRLRQGVEEEGGEAA